MTNIERFNFINAIFNLNLDKEETKNREKKLNNLIRATYKIEKKSIWKSKHILHLICKKRKRDNCWKRYNRLFM